MDFLGASRLLALASAAALLAVSSATAQEALASAQDERARVVTPTRNTQRLAAPNVRKEAAPIDWEAVRGVMRETRERDRVFAPQGQSSLVAATGAAQRPAGLRALSPAQLGRVDAREVAQTRLPLLAPVTADTAPTLRVSARENAFAALADLPDGASIELLGTRMRVVGGGFAMADHQNRKTGDFGPRTVQEQRRYLELRSQHRRSLQSRLAGLDAPYVISRHEEGVDLSFSKFGASYLVAVYCPKPDEDARCAKDDFVLSISQNLAILNEAEGEGQ